MKRIGGFDNHGTLYDDGERMRRSVEEDYLASALLVFETLRNDLLRLGIVQTEYDSKERVFTHKKHIISYPYEWTVGMFKEAALFHLDLLQNLEAKDLTLKDALPSNIVFDFTDPVFVDFLSVVPIEALDKEEWLVTVAGGRDHDLRHAVLRSMYYPFFLIPMLQMGRRQYRKARAQLSTQACNTGNGRLRLERRSTPRRLLDLLRASVGIRNNRTAETLILLCFRWMLSGQSADFGHWIARLQQLIRQLNVTPPTSGYSKFYELKNENYDITGRSDWKAKQINVHRVLEQAVPRRVLDIGANTGWYSLLAEKQGAEVIAVDVDESSIETLYQLSKQRGLRILSLNIAFNELEKQIDGRGTPELGRDRDYEVTPLFSRATERLKADMVLCLGLLHHVVLGEGKALHQVFSTLQKLARRTLLVEFVALEDPLVAGEPSFFPSITAFSESNYNLNAVIKEGRKWFRTHHVLDSNPGTRKLIVFDR
jgi:SAM-dependent methyltransferase